MENLIDNLIKLLISGKIRNPLTSLDIKINA